jgi:predicted branched-subunit amino acid permease
MPAKVLRALAAYLKDWKNLLAHAVVGVIILLVALLLPVPWYVRVAILAAVVLLNVARMSLERRRAARRG